MKTKLKSKKWKSLVSGILLAASASSFLIAPVFAAEYTDPLTGYVDDDLDIFGDDGNTVKLDKATNTIIYDFQGQDHTFTVENDDGITASQGDKYSYIFNNVGADGSKGTLHIYQSNNQHNPYAGVNGFIASGGKSGGKITVNSNLDITATSDYASVGVAVANGADLVINGNVKMRKDDPSNPWGIITKNVHGNVGPGGAVSMDNGYDANYTGARWQPSAFSVGYTRGNITVNGDVDVAVRGTAVNVGAYNAAEGVHPYDLATVSLVGDSTRIITPYREKNSVEGFGEFIEPYYSLACYGGTINVNVKNMEAQKGKVEIVGNIMAMKRSEYTRKSDVYQDGRINLALTTSDSSWKGIIDNTNLNYDVADSNVAFGWRYDPDMTPVYADHSGEVNLWLQNGAQWIYENASRKDGLDYSHMPQYSQSSYGNYDGMSHLSRLVGGKDSASAGIIRVNDNDPIQIAEAEGVTKVWYEHADATPGTIIGGDVKVLNAKTGTEMMLYTGNNGITKGFAEGDTAAEKNNVSEVLNSLAHKLWYMAGDSNLTGSVSIAEGLTASSATMKTGNITFAEGGQGFYEYTPAKDDKPYETGPIVKSENIDETRVGDVNGVVSINVTEAQDSVAASAPSAMYAAGEAEGPLVVDLQGHTLKLNANNQTANYVSTVYVDADKSMEIKDSKGNGVLKVSAGLGADGNADTKANYVYGIRVGANGSFTANTDVEIDGVKSSATQRAYGVYVSTKGNVVFEKDLTIKNVQTGNKVGPNTAGIYADSSSSADAPINITVKGNLNIENVLGSAIRALNTSTISTGGATIKAADMSNGTDYSQYYALQANKGTINLNTGEGITAGILDVTGDMKVTDNKASVINVNMTKGSQWTGAVSNIPGSTYNAPAGQFNLTMAEGSVWNHETGRSVDTLKTTFAGSNVSKLDGSGVIYQNSDKGITVYDYRGDTTVVYGHDAENPLNITGGNFTVKTAAEGSKITLVTDSQGINAGFESADTAAEKNNVKEVLNKLANKLFYTGYKDANLAGVVKIADGLTASSVSAIVKASGDVTFSDGSNGTKTAGQGFYDYTPEQEKPNYKTGAITKSEDISLSRELDESGVAHVAVTESNVTSNFASAIYAGESTDPSSPMTVKMSGKGLALNATQSSGQAAAIYAGANTYIKVINPSAEQKLSITANNTDTRASHGIYALGNAHLNISGPVEITDITTKGDAATGINIQGQQSEINIDGPLTISNVKGLRERGAGMSASGILVTGDSSTVTVSGPVDISGVRGSGIKLVGANTKVSVGGGTITAAEDSDKSHNFYAVRVDKGTLDINMKDGAAGDTTTKITGDMYATGQYGKKVVEYTGGELIDWKDAGILNVALTDKDSFWKGVAAYDQYNDDYGSGGNTAHDIGQFNLYLQNGATWTNEQQSHVTTTTIASKNPVWAGSTLATLHGGKDAANAGLIYQKDNNPISVVNYSGHTTVFYDHDAADPTKIIGGSFNITNAAEGSAITFITDNKGITSGFAEGDSADAKDKVANVLNSLAGKLFYKNYTDGHLAGVVKIAEGLTASSAALKTGDISFSTEDTGTFTPGQGYYAYKTSKPGSQITKEFTTAITGDAAADTVYIEKGVLKDDGTYVFTADSTTITPEKHLIAGGAYVPQIGAAISGSDENHNVTIEMNGNKLTVDTTTDTHTTGIAAIGKGVVNINNAGAMSISAASTRNGQTGALFVNAGGTINIHNAGADNVLTLRANSTAPANAAVIKSMNGVGGVMSTITVDGLVDIVADKSNASGANEAISAVASKVEVGGGVIKAINGAEYAIRAYGEFVSKNRGQVNVNVKKDAEGAIIGAGSNNVQLEGNIYLGGGMDNAGASADVSVGLNTKDSFWKGNVSNANGSSAGIVNLYMGNGATWTGNNLYGNTVNANLDNATWTGYSNGNAMHLKLDNSIWNVNGASKLASFSGNKGSIFVASDAGDISVADYSGNTTVIYKHDADNPTNILGGSFTIGQANTGSNITLITDNQGITKGFNAYDKAEDQNTVNEVLNKLAQKLFYTANDGKLAGTVKIASGLTASSAALKTGDISFSTDATGTKTPGQGFYEYTEMDDSVITDFITGNLDKKYVSLGIETEKGIYNFTQDTVINVTKGDYSSNLSAIESSGGPITINADGKNLDVSYHVLKGSNVARAVATGLSYGKSKDITIKAKSLKLSTDTTGFYGQGVYATGGKITIDADTTISTSAQTESNGIYSGSGGTVTMNGNLDIQKDSNAANYIALKSDDNGVINVNMKDGKAGAGIVKIDGDVFTKSAETYDYWEDETTSTSSTVNLALQGKDSSWNGRSLYEVTSGDDSTSYGTFNLWLTDGAAWTNEKNGKEVPSGFTGSHVTNFTGGSDAAHAGNIFQNDTKKITIENYSGNTNIYYAHTGNGEAAGDYKAGDTVIKHAEKDSVVSLITDNSGVNMSSADSIVNVLNSLAGKLTYSNFTKDENNLTGYVKIADGLTSSSAAMYTGDMAFSKKDGKGSLKDEDSIRPDLPAPDHQIKNEFTTTLTGVKANDKEYYKAGVIKEEGLYQFTQNSSITTTNAHGADMNQATTIDAKGKTLTFNTNVTDNSTIHAIGANSTDGVTITADKLVLNAHSTKGRVEAINVGGQGQQNKDKPMKLTINGDTEMNVKGINYALGLYAAGNSEVTFNGNVTAMGDENSEWGLTSEKGAYGYYGCSLVYSGSNYTLQTGPKVTINGDVNAKIDGNCLFANGGHAKLTINGGGNIEINKDNKHTYYAMMAESGTTSMNVNLDANYDAISARDNKLVLKGNVGASTGAMNANEPELYTKVNLGLATADSVWTGVAHNGFKDEGNKAGDKTFYGAINVFLQNGATWNNEKWGETSKPWGGSGFVGSHVAKFVGGSDAAHAGNIFQNDANNITIDNYSGNTNIFYAHTGNGEAAENYAAGDTVIRHAEKDSVVSLITDNSGIAMDNEYSVTNVLNTLAGKLTYSKFVNGEKNLAGYVKIADGLTASSAAMQTGNIAFNAEDGKGSLENGSMKPGFTYPETQIPESNEIHQGITGDGKTDYQYKKDGILKEDGTYVFTQDPTKIEVESGAAVEATDKDINIDTTKAKLELKGETGIKANGADVTVNGNTGISGATGIDAANGNVTLNGNTTINANDGKGNAIKAGEGGSVTISGQNGSLNGAVNINGAIVAEGADSKVSIDSSKATGIIEGNVTASNGGNVEITLDDANSQITGSYNVDDDSSIVMNIKNGAVWNLTDDDDEVAGMSLLRMAKAPAAAAANGLTVNGGAKKAQTGYMDMTKRTKDLKIASYSGWETIIYGHENAGDKDEDYKSGDTIINKAAKDSGVILSTDNSGINMDDKAAVEATLKALAHKVTYTDHEANGSNLTGMVQIADGLTASSASKYLGDMSWDENGKGQYVDNSIEWKEIYNGNYETLVMKGVRSAATTSMHSWRDNMQDTYTGADLTDEDGIFAKALGGKTSSDVKGVKDSNTYRGVQVGLDKALANGWHAGVAFDYRDGDSNYLLGGKGDNQLYSFGVYGVKNFEDQSYLRVAAKAGRVENEYDVYNEIRTLKLHGDYKANAYGLTMEYGKTFGTEASYFTPKAQLTWSQVGAKDYTAHTTNDSMRIDQDAYSSLVARFGVEAGAKSEKGHVYVGLYGAHEFNGDITASYFAKDGGYKHTSFDGKDTWMEMSIGGSYDLSDNCHIYADFAKDFGGDFERKWKASAGLRFEF
ncbi:MAG: autotransporter outer membrane beta-barrel domain-containing protein [Phascolarctobacterium succinatutens]|uniref:autotransporter outer membrane beta-barrel domain-containing protein n=1 Tax=Phascolarctobacterium succinatutens TaxID=626940 RepID=UPI0023F2B041|nr:autotransporter outer membrane beta-barrel domain-containing protein [Phascolarctobacterium succinatutens]MCI6544292.1 autotransporter outer membrane beta-barrel domain-containing protein [Phascolarctobacterium succinatutens]